MKLYAETEMKISLVLVGVRTAEYEVPDPLKELSVPPDTEISDKSKSVDGSLKEKVMVGDSLIPKLILEALMLIVGAKVSMTK